MCVRNARSKIEHRYVSSKTFLPILHSTWFPVVHLVQTDISAVRIVRSYGGKGSRENDKLERNIIRRTLQERGNVWRIETIMLCWRQCLVLWYHVPVAGPKPRQYSELFLYEMLKTRSMKKPMKKKRNKNEVRIGGKVMLWTIRRLSGPLSTYNLFKIEVEVGLATRGKKWGFSPPITNKQRKEST